LSRDLAAIITEAYPQSRTRVCVDSAPLLERSYAFAAGIGFIGKNNMLIVPGYGSYLFLAEILTTADLAPWRDEPLETRCGTCSRCLEACPTGALERPFCVNAAECLSYQTIEHSAMLNPDTGSNMGDCFFGCDACQEACPFNRGRLARKLALPRAAEILKMSPAEFKAVFGKTAFFRAGLEKTKHNIETLRSRTAKDPFA
jgi:epoxyqueuosine reductase